MSEGFTMIAPLTAAWLGILVSISPCPLATNVAAVSYMGRHLSDPKKTFSHAVLYATGRALVYALLGVVLSAGLLAAPSISFFLQTQMNKVLGPVLILMGIILLEWLPINFSMPGFGGNLQEKAAKLGFGGSLLLGGLFALSFCPVSAALFFGSLLPLTLKSGMSVSLPLLFGVGTALPAIVFALVVSFAGNRLSQAFSGVTQAEYWARRLTGVLFVVLGLYFTLQSWFNLF